MYKGSLDTDTVTRPDGSLLPLRLDLRNHSPTGFSWGYMGSGPSQLALALLADATDDETALEIYFDFKLYVISKLDMNKSWMIDPREIIEWSQKMLYENRKKL